MTDPAEAVGDTLAANLRAARQTLGWRLDDLAARSGVSRGMLQQIETARTNPSIATLARISATLGISIGELVEPPGELGRVVRAADAVPRSGGKARLLISDGRPPFTELWEFRMPPDDEISTQAHPPGTRELLHVHEGALTVTVGGALFRLATGDSLRMRGDRPHAYANPGPEPVHFCMTVVYAGARDPRYADMNPGRP